MSWDIYGNPLRRGYCEVHPDVHQEYPCSICMAQKQQQSQPHDELEQLQYEFAQQGDYIRHLESERAALSTQAESLLDDRKAFVKKEFQLLKEIERLEIELKKRDEQSAALAAQVEALRDHIKRVVMAYQNNTGNEPSLSCFYRALDEANDAAQAAPQQHLRNVRAEAVIDAINNGFTPEQFHALKKSRDGIDLQTEAAIKGWWACWEWADSDDRDKPTLIPAADKYAETIRQGGAA